MPGSSLVALGMTTGWDDVHPASSHEEGENVQRRLYRSRRDRWIAGVCGGLAERFDWDPTMVRLAFVVLSFLPIPTHPVLVYIILWIVAPEAPE